MDFKMNEDTLQEISEAAPLLILTGWPYTNTIGSCWCGHGMIQHLAIDPTGHAHCLTCQCYEFTEDNWVTEQS